MAAWKLLMVAAVLAVAHAGRSHFRGPHPGAVQYAPPAYTAQQANILRTPGNLGQLSTQQKHIQTAFSRVSKADVRASNDALAYPAAPAYAPAPAAYAPAPAAYAPAPAAYAPAPAAYAPAPQRAYAPTARDPAGIVGAQLLGVVYSPSTSVAHITYQNPNDRVNYAY